MTDKKFQVSCKNCNLDAICLPRGLSKGEIDALAIEVKNNIVLQKGHHLFRQGDPFNGIVAIKSGMAKLVTLDTHGNEHILNVLLPGELIGFDGLHSNQYSCSAIALEVVSYCQLQLNQFESFCSHNPRIAGELFKHSSAAINDSHSAIISSKNSAEKKLALFLLNLSGRLKARGFSSLEFHIPLTRQEIGNHLGLTLETVSRMFKQFQNDGLIYVQRKLVKINDLDGLKTLYAKTYD